MRLMKSAFGHRYMITDGWGRDLLPPDNSPDDQAGAQGGEDEQEETAQEVQLPEYKGWSQGTGVPGSGNGSSATAQRGGGTGARPKNRRPPPIARGQAEGIWPRARPACKDPVPVWECTPSSLGGSTPET